MWKKTSARERVHTIAQMKIIIFLLGKMSESFPMGHCSAIPPKIVTAMIEEISRREYPEVLANTGPRP